MNHGDELPVLSPPSTQTDGLLAVIQGTRSDRGCVLFLRGALQTPVNGELEQHIRALLGRGERLIILDLTLMSRIDAAGVGDLVRAYNMVIAANGVLWVVHPTAWVRQILDRVRLLDILSQGLQHARTAMESASSGEQRRACGTDAPVAEPRRHPTTCQLSADQS
jgi:anti-anti-sigma regulatory factor